MESHNQRGEVSIHREIESSWTTNHLIVTEMIKKTLGVTVADKKDTSERIVWLKGQICIPLGKKKKRMRLT